MAKAKSKSNTRQSRLGARVELRVYKRIKRAAALQGRNLSDFIVTAALEAAEMAIRRHDVLELAEADQRQFTDALLNPDPVDSAMERAAAAHKQLLEPS